MAGGGKTGAWSALYLDKGQWIQIDLGDIAKVTKVGTQGRQEAGQWVTEYTVSFSLDGGFYKFFKQANYDVVRVSLRHKCEKAPIYAFPRYYLKRHASSRVYHVLM